MSTLYDSVKIWEAARATSAAIFFFDPITIRVGDLEQRFVDGATGANNPVRRLWQEAQRQWPGGLESQTQCLVSIGTGVPSMNGFGDTPIQVIRALKDIATETERTANEFQDEHQSMVQRGAYIRLTVNIGLDNVGLDEAAKKGRILAATRRYGALNEVRYMLTRFREAVVGINSDTDGEEKDESGLEPEPAPYDDSSSESSGPSDFPGDSDGQKSSDTLNSSEDTAERDHTHPDDSEIPPPRIFPTNYFGHHPQFFKQPAKHYWDHLTRDSLGKYEELYTRICDREDGLVSCKLIVTSYRPEMRKHPLTGTYVVR